MLELDDLKIYRGNDIQITPKIIVTQPTIGQIEEFGEKRYFNAVYTLTAVGADLKWQLWDMEQIDYTQIEDYDLFIGFISKAVSSQRPIYDELMNNEEKYKDELAMISQERLENMCINPLQLILKDIDLADFIPCKNTETDQIILYNAERDITIDRMIYSQIVDAVRKIHGLKRNNETPANETTKMILIDDAREEAKAASQKPYKSTLKPLVSALTVKCGLCGTDKVWDMKINAFSIALKELIKFKIQNSFYKEHILDLPV